MKVGRFFCILLMFFLSISEEIPKVIIKNNEIDFYIGNKILIEVTIDDDCEIIEYDESLNKSEDVIINKYKNGKFEKYYLIRYELFLSNIGDCRLKPFIIDKKGQRRKYNLDNINIKEQPDFLTTIGARITSDKCTPFVGEIFNIRYEIYHGDQQLVDIKLPDLPDGLSLIEQSEEKSKNRLIYNLKLIANQSKEFNLNNILFNTAQKGSIIHFMGFGKVYESNNLTIKSHPIPDNACLVVNSDVKFDLQLTDKLEKTDVARLTINGIFTSWPEVEHSDNLRIYNSQKNIKDNSSILEFVVQPISSGSAEFTFKGNSFDVRDKSLHGFNISKKININFPENISENESPKIKKSLKNNIFYKPINFKYWYFVIFLLAFMNFFRLFLLQNILLNIKYLYSLFLLRLFIKIKYMNYAKYFAKNLLAMQIPVSLRNKINKILYSKR